MLWIFSPEKSDGFGRDRTRDLGYHKEVIRMNAVKAIIIYQQRIYLTIAQLRLNTENSHIVSVLASEQAPFNNNQLSYP